MQRNSHTLQEVKSILCKTSTYEEAQSIRCFQNKCCAFTEKLFDEVKGNIEAIRVSVSKGEHWFLLCHTSDQGIIIIDPTYSQFITSSESNDHPFFIGSREELWNLAQEDEHSIQWFDNHWPTTGHVLYQEDFVNNEMKSKFNTNDFFQVTIGNKIEEKNNKKEDTYNPADIFNMPDSNGKPIFFHDDKNTTNQNSLFKPNNTHKTETKTNSKGKSLFCCFGIGQ